jgi:hypothetical protein
MSVVWRALTGNGPLNSRDPIATVKRQADFQLRRRCGGNFEEFPSDFLAGPARRPAELFYERRDRMVADLEELVERAFTDAHTVNQTVVAMIPVFDNLDITQSRFEFAAKVGNSFESLVGICTHVHLVGHPAFVPGHHQMQKHLQ